MLPPERRPGRLQSSRAILIALPTLVLLVGLTLTIVGQAALNRLSTRMAMERFDQETQLASHRLESALGQADSVILSLPSIARDLTPSKQLAGDPDFSALARELVHLATGRPGLTQVYLGFPSGNFLVARPSNQSAPIELTRGGSTSTFGLDQDGLTLKDVRPTTFNPTTREWYRLAQLAKERAWSEPYHFFASGQLGVTRVLPIYKDANRQELLCVAGVDFDVNTLTAFMADAESEDRQSIIFTERGVVLAYPAPGKGPNGAPRLARAQDPSALDDPVLTGFFRALKGPRLEPAPGTTPVTRYLTFEANAEPMVAAVRSLGPGGPRWNVATLSKRKDVQSALIQYRRSSLVIGGGALLLAMLSAWFLARFIVRERRAAILARAAARAAQRQARELGSYRLVSRLGQGGMGEVWRARHHLLARDAAIKLIRTGGKINGPKKRELEERFRREARALAALRSRNTIELFDYGLTADGTLYYVMELLEGIDLHALVEQFGPQPPERVRQILIQACNSLSEAHQVSLVHRDIKPANLFLCRAADEVDVLKVLDFGLVLSPLDATRAEPLLTQFKRPLLEPILPDESLGDPRLTQADMQLGTPGFMSPEQAVGGLIDARADLYALGCVAWWLLTGHPLFDGETAIGIMLQHIQSEVPDLQSHSQSTLSPTFAHIITQCLEKNAEARPQSAADLLERLRALPPEPGDWSEKQATDWWAEHVPQEPREPANVTEPPGPITLEDARAAAG